MLASQDWVALVRYVLVLLPMAHRARQRTPPCVSRTARPNTVNAVDVAWDDRKICEWARGCCTDTLYFPMHGTNLLK